MADHSKPPSPTLSIAYSATAELTIELAKMLALVAPTSMSEEQQELWLRAAVDALDGIRAHEVKAISAELKRSVQRHNQIVPEIARLVSERRKYSIVGQPRKRTALEWAEGAKERGLMVHYEAWMDEARKRGEIA